MKEITSSQNNLVKQWRKLIDKKKEREQTGQFIVEGFHLVEEAMKEGLAIQVMMTEDVITPFSLNDVETILITEEIAKLLAETETSQMIFAHCKKKESSLDQVQGKRFLLIDAVQDPGNVGTMIRTADAAGVDGIILGKGSADAYNSKTLRAAQGSHFHVPIIQMDLQEAVEQLQARRIPVLATGWTEQAINYREVETESFAIIVGNEGSGVATHLLEMSDEVIYIPMPGRAESLNVGIATGILLFHFA
ncbi:TrmH family RNA methyltransferase [Savagea faecisuis]|uniref:TrmH family RNA methyltransferase n=1 Tax=Savagea faecisuis TaxID=1274803 RepID=A0ABW3GYI6_9BACL